MPEIAELMAIPNKTPEDCRKGVAGRSAAEALEMIETVC